MTAARAVALALMLAFAAHPCLAQPTDAAEGPVLRIGTHAAPPFAMLGEQGQWEGISIDLLAQVAAQAGFRYEFVDVELPELVEGVAAGRLDGSISAITATSDGEARVDYSNSYFQSGLAVAIPDVRPVTVLELFGALASPEFRNVLGALIALSAVAGALTWVAERRRNPQFERSPGSGLFSGLWWSMVTMTTVGYGDKAPVTAAGRMIGMVWMILALGLVALATAQLSAILTADRLSGGIGTVGELSSLQLGALADGPAIGPLKALGARFETFPSVADGLEAVAAGRIDGFVHEEPVLAWESQAVGGVALAPLRFAPDSYAMVLPAGSPYREAINRQILDVLGTPQWAGTIRYYLGPD